ncbi:hypothetical protein EVAR_25450_1 [Eumeta japonica]|uniref:PiggyBac transposable element-derived protein domain-containing protein n=1 Tax=Eumeta variegata TaxID=151549 RepID=A0A4C1VMP5_EUMVA|nr:hypothetical protein EVAR_25450_1 [Eumeta japonica]
MGSHSLRESEICDLLHQNDSEDGFEDDDDSVIDPDFQPLLEDLDLFSHCEENTGVHIDAIIEESKCSVAYKIEPETGAENVMLTEEPDLRVSSNVVVRMARGIPRHQNYQLYFDNYFTSLALLEYLAKDGILSLGQYNAITFQIANYQLTRK